MQAFEYEALDAMGKITKGVISADNARSARREIKARNLILTALKETQVRNKGGKTRKVRTGMSAKDRALVTRQLATLVGAGSPIEQALNTISKQADKPRVRDVLLAVRSDVLEGRSLADSLKGQAKSFDSLYVALVAAGENAGSLPQVLNRLADHMERTEQIKSKVTTALVYPIALAFVAVGVVAGLMSFVVPKVVDQFSSLGQELPTLTVVMITLSDAIRDYSLFALIALVIAVIAFMQALQKRSFRLTVDAGLLKLPFVGKLIRELNAARFSRTMATLVSSGVPVVAGLEAAEKTIANTVIQDAIKAMTVQVKEGKSLSQAMRIAGVFPPMLVYMVASGEQSGTLGELLEKSAVYMESSFETVTNAALTLLEPAIIIIMGGVVALIVLAILMPILQLNTLASL